MSRLAQRDGCEAACFVLAGGTGERLRPLTLSAPKPLLPFGAVHRLLDFTLSNIINSGLQGASVLSQYMHEEIGRHLRRYWGRAEGNRVRFLNRPPASGKRYRGTGDAVAQNLESVPAESDLVLVLSADHVYRMDYGKLLEHHLRCRTGVTVAATPASLSDARGFGVISVDTAGRVLGFQEKPEEPEPIEGRPDQALVNMGVYVFSRRILRRAFDELGTTRPALDFGHDVLPYLAARELATVYRVTPDDGPAYWRDVGTVAGYHASHMDLLRGDLGFDPLDGEWPVRASEDRFIVSDASCAGPERSVVAASARLGNCRVEQSVVAPGVVIEDGAHVARSILLPGVRIGRSARVWNAVVDARGEVAARDRVGFDRRDDLKRFGATGMGVVIVPARARERVWAAARDATGLPSSRAFAR